MSFFLPGTGTEPPDPIGGGVAEAENIDAGSIFDALPPNEKLEFWPLPLPLPPKLNDEPALLLLPPLKLKPPNEELPFGAA
ncbi:unnamed protein product [[Candida] boidinii]|nr:unnamed protein product [[Candida] boidinii]